MTAAQRVHGPRAGSASGQGHAKRAGIPRLRGASGADARVRRTTRARSRRFRRETIVKKRTFPVELAPGRSRIVWPHCTTAWWQRAGAEHARSPSRGGGYAQSSPHAAPSITSAPPCATSAATAVAIGATILNASSCARSPGAREGRSPPSTSTSTRAVSGCHELAWPAQLRIRMEAGARPA